MSPVAGEDHARPSVPDGPSASLRWRQLAAVSLGQGFEFYDFTVYGFFAVPISRLFFPASDPWTSLLLALAGYGVGYGARPLGALVLGVCADRRGRRPALVLSVILMALGTLGMAVVPGYATLGLLAPGILVVARLVQGFALGGEIGPATAYLLEASASRRRGCALAWPYATNGAAVLAAGLVGGGLATVMAPVALDRWGWRLALGIGLGIVPAGLAIRSLLPDAPAPVLDPDRSVVGPVLARPAAVLAAVLVMGTGTVPFSVATFMTTYAQAALHLDAATALFAAVSVGLATLAVAPLAGRLSDRFGSRPILLLSRIGMSALAWPAFAWLADAADAAALLSVSALLAAVATLGSPAGLQLVAESMPVRSRATGVALAYTLGISVFGGLTPLAAAALIEWTGSAVSPAILLLAAGLVGSAAALRIRATEPSGPGIGQAAT